MPHQPRVWEPSLRKCTTKCKRMVDGQGFDNTAFDCARRLGWVSLEPKSHCKSHSRGDPRIELEADDGPIVKLGHIAAKHSLDVATGIYLVAEEMQRKAHCSFGDLQGDRICQTRRQKAKSLRQPHCVTDRAVIHAIDP